MLHHFLSYIEQQQLFTPQQRGLLAVSGGIDSVVMLHLMHRAGFPVAIAHCNFHLRPGDCDRDEQFVRQLANHYQIPLFVAQFDTHAYAEEEKLSVEEAARNLRYRYFETLLRDHHFDYIATAHHRDDATETFFINLLRGTGISGLHGILPRNGDIVRPMLVFSRQQIEAYAEQENLSHVEDVTNQSLAYRRNQIRHQLLPLLRSINPSIDEIMQRNITHLSDAEQLYRQAVDSQRQQYLKSQGDSFLLSHHDLMHLHPQRTLLFEFLQPFGFNTSVVDSLLQLQGDPHFGQQFLSSQYQLLRSAEGLLIEPIRKDEKQNNTQFIERFEVEQSENYQVTLNNKTLSFCIQPRTQVPSLKVPPTQALYDVNRLAWPLSLRSWQEADRIAPYGMSGTQLVSDLFTHHHYTPHQKRESLMLCDADNHLLWAVALRASRYAAISTNTTLILIVTMQ